MLRNYIHLLFWLPTSIWALPSANTTITAAPSPLNTSSSSATLVKAEFDTDVLSASASAASQTSLVQAVAQLAALSIPTTGPAVFVANATVNPMLPKPTSARDVPNAKHKRAGGLSAMIIGDSISEGQQGDWTWRYRIWQWWQSQSQPATMIGPYPGTFEPTKAAPPAPPLLYGATAPPSPLHTAGGYAVGVDPGWSSDHFAYWGRQAAQANNLLPPVLQEYVPDVLLVELGFNDIGWGVANPQQTLEYVFDIVSQAQKANPHMRIAVANIPQRTSLGSVNTYLPYNTTKYNDMLADSIGGWSTESSPVILVDFQGNYTCNIDACPAGYDGLHPNAMGEFEIARAFSYALVAFGYGDSPLEIPNDIPARPCPVPSNIAVEATDGGYVVTWDAVYGAYNYDVQTMIEGIISWAISPLPASSNRYDGTWTVANFTYGIRVRSNMGDIQSDWTDAVYVTAHPHTAPGPSNVEISGISDGFQVTWDPPTDWSGDIVEYVLYWFDADNPCAYLSAAGFTDSPATITGLVDGHRYLVAPSTWSSVGGGFPDVGPYVIAGGAAMPAAPNGLVVISTDATTVHMTWDEIEGAAGYHVWTRQLNNESAQLQTNPGNLEFPCADIGWIAGVWNYEYCM